MKTNLTSRSSLLALLMAVLIFSTSFTIFAEQKSVEVQAKIAAERDAETDVNKLLWGSVGVPVGAFCSLVGAATIVIGALSAVSNEFIGAEATSSCITVLLLSEPAVCACVGLGCGLSLFTAIGITRPSNPPPERLIGKSPEYVDFYINAYRAKARRLKGLSTAMGAAGGCGFVLILLAL